jgi:hypothetical protein
MGHIASKFSCEPFGGVPGRILAAWSDRRIRLVLSASILAEYREVGAVIESRYGGHDFEAVVALLALNSELIDTPDYLDPPVCSDADDDKFLACAKAGGAEIVVSETLRCAQSAGGQPSRCSRPGSLLTAISRIISEARQSA